MAFQGSLKEIPLPDIIQLVSVSGKTGVFVLEKSDERGEIYLRDGQIIHAVYDNLQGEEAIYALAIWPEGDFHFQPGVEADTSSIQKSNTNLLMEAARRLDEWKILRKKIPSELMVPHVVYKPDWQKQVIFSPHEWSIITQVDGRRNIAEIARTLNWGTFDVAKLLYGLITQQLIELKPKEESQ